MTSIGAATAAAALPQGPLRAREPASSRRPSAAGALQRYLEREVPPLVTRHLAEEDLPGGFTVAAVAGASIVYSGAFGRSDREANLAMNAEALFPIGSVTKTFTAALALKLAARGVVDLDAPVQRHLPPGLVLHPSLVRVPVTLMRLLTHRQGWPRDHATRRNLRLNLPHNYDPTIADPASFSRAEFYRGLAETQATLPVTEWNYSNMGFHFAAHVLELATGRGMEELLAGGIARPLGMQRTVFRPSAAQSTLIPSGYAYDLAHEQSVKVPAWTAGEIVGGAFLHSTADDLARYLRAMMNPGATARLLGGARWQAMLVRHYIEFVERNIPMQQALAWREMTFGRYGPIMFHSGEADGHNAFVGMSRPRRLGLVLLTNNDFGTNEALAARLLLLLLRQDFGM